MGRIDDLIQQYCPEGVESVAIKDFAKCSMGEFVHKNKQDSNAPYPVFNGGTTNTGFYKEYNTEENKVIVSARGAGAGFVNLVEQKFWAGNSCHVITILNTDVISYKFLYYALKDIEDGMIKHQQKGGGVPSVSKAQLESIQIPIPPLPVQEAIVEILDKFDRLSAELQAELQARKQQYEYYRNQLLTRFAPEQPVTEYSLGELGTLTRGRRFVRDDVRESGQPCIHYGDMYTYYGLSADKARTYLDRDFPKKMRYAEKGDVVIVGAGENDLDIGVGMVWEGDEPAAVHDACYILQHNINPKFIAHYLRTSFYHDQIRKYVNSAKICSISAENIGKAKILVPSVEEQARIVAILDKFEALVNDLSQGLPAEIAAVQEQYEYYRNKLLTFKTKE